MIHHEPRQPVGAKLVRGLDQEPLAAAQRRARDEPQRRALGRRELPERLEAGRREMTLRIVVDERSRRVLDRRE
jgi:hypothetical protein